jgi:hypothetical protein
MRLRHNKKRNTAFVYEALVRELTKSIIKNNTFKRNKIVQVMKEHFQKDSSLLEELEIYKSLYETSELDAVTAEKLMIEAKLAYSKLDKKKLFIEQSALIKKINKSLDGVFANFVPNYKNLASLYAIFNDSANVKERVLLEQRFLNNLTSKSSSGESNTKDPIDNLVFKSFVKRFNEKYCDSLNEGQKELLTKYVASFSDNGLALKVYLNDEIGTLKEKVKRAIDDPVIEQDQEMRQKTEAVLSKLEGYKDSDIDVIMLEEVIKIQSLVQEIEKDGN